MSRMTLLLDRFLDFCGELAMATANILLAATLVLGFANILVREALGKGVIWVFPWTLVLFAWIVFLGYYVVFWKKSDVILEFLVIRLGWLGKAGSFYLSAFVTVTLNAIILSQFPKILALKAADIEIIGIPGYVVTLPLFFSSCLIVLSVVSALIHGPRDMERRRHDLPAGD